MPATVAPAKYVMDLDTYRHLTRWALRFGPWARENALTNLEAMVKLLESLTTDEASVWMDLGWDRLANHVAQLNDGMPY